MRHGRRDLGRVAASTALALLALAAGAAAAGSPPIAGATYHGHSTGHGRISFHVGTHGRLITTYSATGRLTCNRVPFRGGRFHWRVGPGPGRREPAIRIHSDGTFAITVHTHQPLRSPHGEVVRTMRGTYTLKGHFAVARAARTARRHQTAAGTLRAVLTAPGGLRCASGTQRWSARGGR